MITLAQNFGQTTSENSVIMANILIHSLIFAPDGVSTAYLYTGLAKELRRLGHSAIKLKRSFADTKVLRIILSYTDFVQRAVWRKA